MIKRSKSFMLESVRKSSNIVQSSIFNKIYRGIQISKFDKAQKVTDIGAGRNYNLTANLAFHSNDVDLSSVKFRANSPYVGEFTLEDKIDVLYLNPNRGDVTIPASKKTIFAQ